ncbi:MAG TPA: nucleoside deaminase [Alphaproteobacteria bacterium]
MSDEERFLRQAIELAYANIEKGGRPFGAVVVKDGAVIATGVNEVHATNDPTDHAEMVAIRAASRALGSASLDGCTVYASGQPCPMCMAAMRVAGITDVAYAYSAEDGAAYGFSTAALFSPERAMSTRHVPVRLESRPDLYADWQRRHGKPS